MKLIDNWADFPKMFSVQAMAAVLAIQTAWETMPLDLKAQVPPSLVWYVSIALLVLGIAGRLVQQKSVSGEESPPAGEDSQSGGIA